MSSKAYDSLMMECDRFIDTKLETGGVFLGIIYNDNYYIIENIPPGENSRHGHNSFEYDAYYVSKVSTNIANKYISKLDVLGLWHTHWDGLPIFSASDMSLNNKYTEIYERNIISAIITGDRNIELYVYEVEYDRNISLLNLNIGNEYIPKQYMKTCNPENW